jgi:hypothetical protein
MANGNIGLRAALAGMVAMPVVVLGGAAQARYTAIDVTGIPGEFLYRYIGGYCDAGNGDDCDKAYTLPYYVTFAGGTTNKLSLRSDGTIQFVGDLLASPPDNKHRFEVLATVDTGIDYDGQLSGDVIGQEYSFGPPVFPEANYSIVNPILNFQWFSCQNSQIETCFNDLHYVTLSPSDGGFSVVYGGINDKGPEFLSAGIASQATVPEPGAWALLVLGFGGIGATLRSRRFATASCGVSSGCPGRGQDG